MTTTFSNTIFLLEDVTNWALSLVLVAGDEHPRTVFHKCLLVVSLLRQRSPCCWMYRIKRRVLLLMALPPLGLPPLERCWMAVCGV
jgi:hypothetical protein